MKVEELIEKREKDDCIWVYVSRLKERFIQDLKSLLPVEDSKLKLLWTDVEDWICCEIRWYWKDGICYVKDVINKRVD